jgi:hypothetical protein
MRRRFWVVCGCFFLGGEGEGKRISRVHVPEKFSQDEWAPNSPVCVGFLDPRTPWADAYDVLGFDNPSTCSHSDDSGGSATFVPLRTPRSSGHDFLCTYGLCYMLYVCYMLYASYV